MVGVSPSGVRRKIPHLVILSRGPKVAGWCAWRLSLSRDCLGDQDSEKNSVCCVTFLQETGLDLEANAVYQL